MLRRTLRPALLTLTATLTVGSVVAALALPAQASGGRADPMCDGKAATIVGANGNDIQGTSGDDVIITNGAQHVSAEAGDDTVCVTGGTFFVYDGPGDDVIDATKNTFKNAYTELADGDDTFYGSPIDDFVVEDGGGADHVFTGAGSDTVYHADTSSTPPAPGAADADAIDLGPGPDLLVADDLPAGSSIKGSGGQDKVEVPHGPGSAWSYDVSGAITRDGQPFATWSGFETYYLVSDGTSATFTGDRNRQVVGTVGGHAPTAIALRGGNDVVASSQDPGQRLTIDGGIGRDTFDAIAGEADPHRILADLSHGFVSSQTYHGTQVARATVSGIEDVTAAGYTQAHLIGSPGRNRLRLLDQCGPALVEGLGGSDTLRSDTDRTGDEVDPAGCAGVKLSGGGGNDVLVGDAYDDLLVGGAGKDLAQGGPGRDRCVAEARSGCEHHSHS